MTEIKFCDFIQTMKKNTSRDFGTVKTSPQNHIIGGKKYKIAVIGFDKI